ncbi:hypothetical protein V5P93_003991 [Actinokineospora auranticolor]|uniref:hypothetical protein n=1 Tax=Actinokineospora auranticolor TaxID=155976 RepID=UPI000CEC049D|nr:hypothetical protein [Actinokineospora auranticolor]
MLAASPQQIPQRPGRVLLTPNPRWITRHPAFWWDGALTHTPDVEAIHVEQAWSLWSDGALVRGHWATPADPAHGPREAAPTPTTLATQHQRRGQERRGVESERPQGVR